MFKLLEMTESIFYFDGCLTVRNNSTLIVQSSLDTLLIRYWEFILAYSVVPKHTLI